MSQTTDVGDLSALISTTQRIPDTRLWRTHVEIAVDLPRGAKKFKVIGAYSMGISLMRTEIRNLRPTALQGNRPHCVLQREETMGLVRTGRP
jgi:hypothetical protein